MEEKAFGKRLAIWKRQASNLEYQLIFSYVY